MVGVLLAGTAGASVIGPDDVVQTVGFEGSQNDLRAQVVFSRVDGSLVIRLSNIGKADVLRAEDVLTAVFFDLAGKPELTMVSAVISVGSYLIHPDKMHNPIVDGDVGGEWAYRRVTDKVWDVPGNTSYGISTCEFDSEFTQYDRFSSNTLMKPDNVQGVDFGLLPTSYVKGTGQQQVEGNLPLIIHEVTFIFDGLPEDFDMDTGITNVWFQYGFNLGGLDRNGSPHPYFPATRQNAEKPEPMTLSLMALGSIALWRRRKAA